jgi:serine protease inhibitor
MARNRIILSAVLAGVLATGCHPATGPNPSLSALPRNLTAGERVVIGASNAFSFDLLRRINAGRESQNVFISPLSVSMALGMTMNGAAGETFDEMRTMLGFGTLPQPEINQAYRGLIDLLLGLDPKVRMGIGNSIWYSQLFPFERSFFDTVRGPFSAEISPLDFSDPRSVTRINDWARQATAGRIPTVLESIPAEAVMYLINAIYFKGDWTNRFEPAATMEVPFEGLGGRPLRVRMMNQDGTFRHAFTPEYQAVDLPYGNGAFVMTVLVPNPGRDINTVLAGLDEAGWTSVIERMREGRIMVGLPRFRLERDLMLNETLQALGMESAFSPRVADFSRMSPSDGLYVSQVRHQTFVEVDEVGTEAAAVTTVEIRVVSAPPAIVADRPFLFAIRERFSDTILFVGKIVEPVAPTS